MIEEKLQEIRHLFGLIENRISAAEPNNNVRVRLVHRKMNMELDYFMDRLEELYYKYVLKQKDITQLEESVEKQIFTSQTAIHKVLPYMMLISMMEDNDNPSGIIYDTLH
jgi:hypothetical protein